MGKGKMGGIGEQKWEVSHTILIFKGCFLSSPFSFLLPSLPVSVFPVFTCLDFVFLFGWLAPV